MHISSFKGVRGYGDIAWNFTATYWLDVQLVLGCSGNLVQSHRLCCIQHSYPFLDITWNGSNSLETNYTYDGDLMRKPRYIIYLALLAERHCEYIRLFSYTHMVVQVLIKFNYFADGNSLSCNISLIVWSYGHHIYQVATGNLFGLELIFTWKCSVHMLAHFLGFCKKKTSNLEFLC